ncbi:MAG: hypothetical protein ACJAWI_000496 [Marinomonas primoryensis]|jgi:hypothetical protein
MKKLFLKKLQSLTAILVLNAVPVSFAQSSISYEAVGSLTRVLTDERKNTLASVGAQERSLKQLYLDNSLAYIQKHADQPTNYQYQLALALVEEAYQDDYDTLLDQYEHELGHAVTVANPDLAATIKNKAEEELMTLKIMRRSKIAEFNRQFGTA